MIKPSSQLQIPRAAIRTMEKDLAGVVMEDWELTLAESEILELLKKYKQRLLEKEVLKEKKAEVTPPPPPPKPKEKEIVKEPITPAPPPPPKPPRVEEKKVEEVKALKVEEEKRKKELKK